MRENSFSKDSLFTFLTNVFVFILGFSTIVIISRVLGPEGKGIYSLILLIPGLIISFASFGIGTANIYFTGNKKYEIKDIVGNSILLSILIGAGSIFIFWVLTQFPFFKDFMEENKIASFYLWIMIFTVPLSFLSSFLQGVIQGMQKINTYNVIRIFEAIIHLCGVFIILYLLGGGILAAIGSKIIAIFGLTISTLFIIKKMGIFKFNLNKRLMKESFIYGSKIYLANAFSFLNYRLDMFLIAFFMNPFSVGIYSIAVGLSEKLFVVSGAFSTVLFPKISSSKNKEADDFSPKVARHTFFIFLLLALFLIITSYPLILIFFGRDFLPAVLPLIILMPGIIAFGVGGVLAADLSGRGKPHFAIIGSLTCLLINIPLNILLIPKWGIAGAAVASAIGYWADTLVVLIAFSRTSKKGPKEILLIKKQDFRDYLRFILAFKEKLWKRN